MTVALPPDLQQFVHEAVTAGRFSSEDQLMTQAVRLLRQQEADFERFRTVAQRGIVDIERGNYDEVDVTELDQYFDDIIAEVDRENAERLGRAS